MILTAGGANERDPSPFLFLKTKGLQHECAQVLANKIVIGKVVQTKDFFAAEIPHRG